MQAASRVLGVTGAVFMLFAFIISCSESPPRSDEEVVSPGTESPAIPQPAAQTTPERTTAQATTPGTAEPTTEQPARPGTAEPATPQPDTPQTAERTTLEPATPEANRAGVSYYVRQTVGNDANDGLSPETAWEHIGKLSTAMHAGDTAYIAPGLYRDQITVLNDGAIDNRITFIADAKGQHTGDQPGVVMITGADPVEPGTFRRSSAPEVYQYSPVPVHPIQGVVEMDGLQYRYTRARDTREHLLDGLSELEVVNKLPYSFFYDQDTNVLHIHTSDGRSPDTHEIELIRRGNGISITGKHFVSVIGFTFRHMGDAGVNFFKQSGDGIAIDNTSYGSRQGIRVYNATNILVYRNTMFRNENCGVYFAAQSTNGSAIGNTAYENIKGVRWSSDSVSGLAIDNALFDNHEAGISVEKAHRALLRRNRLVNNAKSQLLVIQAEYASEDNCFETGSPDQLTADFVFTEHFKTLAEYQKARRQDLHSREGGCGPMPQKVDVRRLHAETVAYAERARDILSKAAKSTEAGTTPTEQE